MKALRLPSALARDERGTSIVELAMFTPIVATLLLGAVDLGQGVSTRHDIHQAANRAMELAMTRPATRDPDTGELSYDYVRQAAVNALVEVNRLGTVTLTKWRECNGTVQT